MAEMEPERTPVVTYIYDKVSGKVTNRDAIREEMNKRTPRTQSLQDRPKKRRQTIVVDTSKVISVTPTELDANGKPRVGQRITYTYATVDTIEPEPPVE